jgi:hypothetical protein
MRVRLLLSLLLLLGIAGCNATTSNQPVSATARRSYNGTASVGDFLNMTLDPVAKTLTYTDVSNGETGVVPYTANADGTYTLSDPNHNLVAAYEVPNYALLVQANKTGATKDVPALITAVLSGKSHSPPGKGVNTTTCSFVLAPVGWRWARLLSAPMRYSPILPTGRMER